MKHLSTLAIRLGTNYAATDQERIHIQDILLDPTIKLRSLQKEMDDAHAHYMDLKQQHSTLLNEIEQYQLLMAPIRRLPAEIIQEIFRHCMPQKHNAIIGTKECPLLLARICSRWREIALNTGSLWASIHVPIPNHLRDDPLVYTIQIAERRVEALLEWLERSGECLLDITLHNSSPCDPPSEIYDIILDALKPFAERWGTLTCNATTSKLSPITELPVDIFPELHTITFKGKHTARNVRDPNFWIKSGLIRAPNLRRLTFTDMNEDFLRFPLRWAQLTHVSLQGSRMIGSALLSLADIYRLLVMCPLLRFCHLIFSGQLPNSDIAFFSANNVTPTSISLHRLTDFAIHADTSENTSDFFDTLNLPVLGSLLVYTNKHGLSTLPKLLLRTNQALQRLTLNPYALSYAGLIACLCACPNLVELTFDQGSIQIPGPTMNIPLATGDHWTINDELLQLFIISPQDFSDNFLPRIESLSCGITNTFTDSGLLAFLKSRSKQMPGAARLKEVSIDLSRKQQLPMLNELEKLEQNGMKCTLRYLASPHRTLNNLHLASEGTNLGRQIERKRSFDPSF